MKDMPDIFVVLLVALALFGVFSGGYFIFEHIQPSVEIELWNKKIEVILYPGGTEWKYETSELDEALAKAKEWISYHKDKKGN